MSTLSVADSWTSGTQPGAGVPEDVMVPRGRAVRTTQPLTRAEDNGPSLADFEALARGQRGPVVLAERYRVSKHLRSGGMADVFAGEHIVSRRPVALKIITRRYAEDEQAMAALLREARLNAHVPHPNVVDIFDVGSTPQGIVFLAMERLEGEDLRSLLRDCGPLSWPQVRNYMLQICAGLAALHRAGLIHRDLKPSNCFCVFEEGEDQIKLLDFGVATVVDHSADTGKWGNQYGEIGDTSGTPAYMSPEQALGHELDYRSDIYSAGVLLCEMLTGELPARELLDEVPAPAPALSELAAQTRELDPRVEAIYQRAVALDPAERFASVEEMVAALAEIPANGAHESLIAARLPMLEEREQSSQLAWLDTPMTVSRGRVLAWVLGASLLVSLMLNLLLRLLSG